MEAAMNSEPQTLREAIMYFSNPENCINYLAKKRWPNGIVTCPGCGSESVSFNPNRRTWKCSRHHPKREFSIKVGTVFEDSPISLDKWLIATWMLTNCKNGVSSCEIARDLGVTQKTAWFMLHRIRLALQDEHFGGKLRGEVEVDETFIGGKARNMHIAEKKRRITATGGKDKMVVDDRRKKTLHTQIKKHVTAGSALYSDALQSYDGLAGEYIHKVIDHAVSYVDGAVHTNNLENFWSLLKRGIRGTYVSVEPFHLFRYLDEQSFRYNNRKGLEDEGRFAQAVSQIIGKRVTFTELTGNAEFLQNRN
jgi:transposase-like protein